MRMLLRQAPYGCPWRRALVISVLLLSVGPRDGAAQPLRVTAEAATDAAQLDADVARMARTLASALSRDTAAAGALTLRQLVDRVYVQLASGNVQSARATLRAIQARPDAPTPRENPALLLLMARSASEAGGVSETALPRASARLVDVLEGAMRTLNDRDAFEVAWYFETPAVVFERNLSAAVARAVSQDSVSATEAAALIRSYVLQRTLQAMGTDLPALLAREHDRRYVQDTAVLVRTRDGATLSAVVVRPRSAPPLPAAFNFTIYTDTRQHVETARRAASYGYVGVVADARGKRLSLDSIRPYETETGDTHAVLDWIVAQPWSDGRVGMYGASYDGFAAWAATKHKHPALKTIATSVAALPGQGLPMENNVFLTANYGWPFYVTNTRTLDNATYFDRARWDNLAESWYRSGRPFRDIDAIDGTPNPLFQRGLQHPTYDAYWQRMVPYAQEFAAIDIPVLSITGYFDDGQISALHYQQEHVKYRPDAEHYLVVGPYDHGSAGASRKPMTFRGYALDSVAQFNGTELTFAWLNHVLRGAPRPALLKDRITYQVMGANEWRHGPSWSALQDGKRRWYLSGVRQGTDHTLDSVARPFAPITRRAFMSNRTTQHVGYYPSDVVGRDRDFGDALTFLSTPLDAPADMSGGVSGMLQVTSNARDFDFHVTLYEVMPNGQLFHLSYYLGRASHVRDLSRRALLTPGATHALPFHRSRVTGRRLQAGSRLLLVIDINKDAGHQVNHGTGADVSVEHASVDAAQALDLRLMPGSYIEVPLHRRP